MKVTILKSKTGKVIATFQAEPQEGLKLEPQIAKSQKLELVEVTNYYSPRLALVYNKKSARK
jgi:hypothetical protein